MKNISALFLFVLTSIIAVNTVLADETPPELNVQQLDSGVYLHTSYQVFEGFGLVASNGLVVLDQKNAYIVDTPASSADTEKLVNWFTTRGFNVKGSIATHFHEDSAAGIEWLNSKLIPTYTSSLTNKLLGKKGRAQARNSINEASFWLVKDQIEVFYPGPGHSQDNVVVWLPKKKILFGSCFVRAKEAKSLGNLGDAVVSAWAGSAEKLLFRYADARLVVPGHGKVGDVSLLEHTRKLASTATASKK